MFRSPASAIVLIVALLSVTSSCLRRHANEPAFFDPDGYYFPASKLMSGGYELEYLEIRTLEYYYDGAAHYDAPRALPPSVRLSLRHTGSDKASKHDCPKPVITRDALRLANCATLVGLVSLDGLFLDKRGQYWNRFDVNGMGKAILRARLSIVRADAIVLDHEIVFTYWAGD